jgi:hypothetical protein
LVTKQTNEIQTNNQPYFHNTIIQILKLKEHIMQLN